jgi:D-sedoheptulose 7-phosphate isomerase
MYNNNTMIESSLFVELFHRHKELFQIREAFELLRDGYELGGTLLLCGNGGSKADADHIVGELMIGFPLPRKLSEQDPRTPSTYLSLPLRNA